MVLHDVKYRIVVNTFFSKVAISVGETVSSKNGRYRGPLKAPIKKGLIILFLIMPAHTFLRIMFKGFFKPKGISISPLPTIVFVKHNVLKNMCFVNFIGLKINGPWFHKTETFDLGHPHFAPAKGYNFMFF